MDILRKAKKDGRDFRPKNGVWSVADSETAANKNKIREKDHTIYACECGSRKFHLMQGFIHGTRVPLNIKAVCVKCRNVNIIAWNTNGHVMDLDDNIWSGPVTEVHMKRV